MAQNKSWGGARHGMVCIRKGCRQCLLLKTVEEDLHPSDVPQRSPWTFEPASDAAIRAAEAVEGDLEALGDRSTV